MEPHPDTALDDSAASVDEEIDPVDDDTAAPIAIVSVVARVVAAVAAVLAVAWLVALALPVTESDPVTLWALYGQVGSRAVPLILVATLAFAAWSFGTGRATSVAVGLVVAVSVEAAWEVPQGLRLLTDPAPPGEGAGAGVTMDMYVRAALLGVVVVVVAAFAIRCLRRGWGLAAPDRADAVELVCGGLATAGWAASWFQPRVMVENTSIGYGQVRTWPLSGPFIDQVNWVLCPALILLVLGILLAWRPVRGRDGQAATTRSGVWAGAAVAAGVDVIVRGLSGRDGRDVFEPGVVPAVGPMALTLVVSAGFLAAGWAASRSQGSATESVASA